MGGGDEVSVPAPTAEERRLQAEQAETLRMQREIITEQYRMQQLFMPLFLEREGLVPRYDTAGKITGIVEGDEAKLRGEVEMEFLKRTQAALRGELPVNPALLRDLAQEERTLQETLRKNLGPGYETSSPGIESLSRFGEYRTGVLEAARRGDLTLANTLGIQREQGTQANYDALVRRVLGLPLETSQAVGMNVAGYQFPLSYLQGERQMQLQAAQFNASQPSLFGELLGTAVGAGSYFGFGKLFGAFTPSGAAASTAPAIAGLFL